MSLASIINTAWMLRCRSEWNRFSEGTKCVRAHQKKCLFQTIGRNHGSQFGKKHRFGTLRQIQDYRDRIPLMDTADLEQAVARIADGEPRVLTWERVLLLQPTSGSNGPAKWIPYTASLRREYQRMIAAWIGNLFRERPDVRRGRAYWSISPAGQQRCQTKSGLTVGFDDDTAYLGFLERWMARQVLAVSPSIAREQDMDQFRYLTLLYLLRARDLSLVSIWSPTFLTVLLDQMECQSNTLLQDIRDGTVLGKRPEKVHRELGWPAPHRSRELEHAMHRAPFQRCRTIWPHLALVSCWMDGSSRILAEQLRARMERIDFQAKGLLATEATVSFPVVGQEGCALAYRSHFFEFVPEGESIEEICLADQLDIGQKYSVVVTTGGGLWRYSLHDVVEVTGKWNQCPLLRFQGRGNRTSDLVGEKLQETFVRTCIESVLKRFSITTSWAVLVAVEPQSITVGPSNRCRYRLEIEASLSSLEREQLNATLAEELENQLSENPHYRYARELGQLAAVEIKWLPGPPGEAWKAYEAQQLNRGIPLGSIKPCSLMTQCRSLS
jgi:hypothetical protein